MKLFIFVDLSIIDMNTESQPASSYFILLERTLRQIRKFSQRELAKRAVNISSEQWLVLKSAHDFPGVTQKEIADSTYKDPASVTRMIDLLEKRKLIARKARTDDRRTYGIFLTEEGEMFVNDVLPIMEEMRKFGLKNVSPEEIEVFQKVLNKIYYNFE